MTEVRTPQTVATGVTGLIGSTGSFAVSMSSLEPALRVSALILGCLVSLFTCIALWPKVRAAFRQRRLRRDRNEIFNDDDLPYEPRDRNELD